VEGHKIADREQFYQGIAADSGWDRCDRIERANRRTEGRCDRAEALSNPTPTNDSDGRSVDIAQRKTVAF
jgi:hypothetical protein